MATRGAAARGGRAGRGRGRGEIPAQEGPLIQPPAAQYFELDRVAKRYKNLGGKTFSGTGTVIEALAWLKTCEKILEGLRLGDEDKAIMGAWLMQEQAELWWESLTAGNREAGRTWDGFKELFKEKYVPEQALERMHDDFANLQQGDLSVQDYLNKFTLLSPYAPELVATAKSKNKRFILGLRRQYHDRAMAHVKLEFNELVEMTATMKTLIKGIWIRIALEAKPETSASLL